MLGNNGSRLASWIIGFLPTSRCLGLKIWLLRHVGGIEIGDGCEIWSGAKFCGRYIKIGKNCHFGEGCYVRGARPDGAVTIGDNVSCGPGVFMTTGSHNIGDSHRRSGPGRHSPVEIGDGTGLSVRCMVMAGVRIGKGCIVGPGVVVSSDVPDNTMLGQHPPRSFSLPEDGIFWD